MTKGWDEFFALIDAHGHVIAFTVRSRRKDVPSAAEEWSGYPFERVKGFGYRIAKVRVSEIERSKP